MINSKSAARELSRRKASSAATVIPLDPSFPKQNNFVEDTARFIDAQCSRRAGKSTGLGKRFFKTMQKHPKSKCFYLGLTRDSAREIMWPVLQELDQTYNLGCTFIESKLTVVHPNGAKLQLYGADMKNFIKRLRGQKSPGIGLDEAQDFGIHVQSLIDDVLTPMLVDYPDSWLAITGTPGPVPQGYFYAVTQERKYGYSHHEWTILENPYISNPQAFIDDIKTKREWDDLHPTLRREWKNQWVLDVDALWIQYTTSKNDYKELPTLSGNKKYNYILGVDWGFKDSDALAVLAYSDESAVTYLVEELITPRQGLTELTAQIEAMRKKYDISKIVMDEGAGGKKMAEEMRRQHAIPVEPADKIRKQETVDFFNDALRTSRFKAPSASRFVKDSYLVQIDWEKSSPHKTVIKKNPHSDIIDAVLYAFKCSPAYAWSKPEKPKPKIGSKEWSKAQQSEMWDKANEHFQEQQEREKKIWGNWED
jgi:hypothetical protein